MKRLNIFGFYLLNLLLLGGVVAWAAFVDLTAGNYYFLLFLAPFLILWGILGPLAHETGHLLMGLATGYRLCFFEALGMRISRGADGKLRTQKNRRLLSADSGMYCDKPYDNKMKRSAYLLGGIYANILFGLGCVVTLILVNGYAVLNQFLLCGIFFNLYRVLVTAYPYAKPETAPDSVVLASLNSSQKTLYAFYLLGRAKFDIETDKTLSAAVSEAVKLNDFDLVQPVEAELAIIVYKYHFLEEDGGAKPLITALSETSSLLPGRLGMQAALEYACFIGLYEAEVDGGIGALSAVDPRALRYALAVNTDYTIRINYLSSFSALDISGCQRQLELLKELTTRQKPAYREYNVAYGRLCQSYLDHLRKKTNERPETTASAE